MMGIDTPFATPRRLEDGGDDDDDSFNWMTNYYDHTTVVCLANTPVPRAEDGTNDTNALLYRLCPHDSGATWDGNPVCSSNYGEYLMSLQEYLALFLNQFPVDKDDDDAEAEPSFDPSLYTGCSAYEQANEDGDDNDNANYYIGPSCTKYGTVKLTLYLDQYCSEESTYLSFFDVTGYRFPSGGLVPTGTRFACSNAVNDDDDAAVDYCKEYYQRTPYRCESRINDGGDTSGCAAIDEALTFHNGNASFWSLLCFFVFAMAIVGYFSTQMMQKYRRKKQQGAVNGDALMKK